ncbi:MAG TPA: DinB family protein [Vicinamibacterales bacterium]|nr:DinB family protein [Vicinamibacterales bacterium]
MDADKRQALIDEYKDGYRVISEALAGATDEDLDARPAPNKWTAREVVHHLADSEMTAAIRLRLLLALDEPQIVGYDQDEFARRLHYDRPIEASVEAFKSARRTTAELLERMSDADWQRAGTHTEHGRYTAERWLEIYAPHAHKHAEQIKVARSAARKQEAAASARK